MEIPKTIHQIWIQGYDYLPKNYLEYSRIWRRYHLDYKYILWDDKKLINYITENYPQYLNHYINSNYTNKSNIGRYLILHGMGGIYADTDSYPIKSLNDFDNKKYDIVITKRRDTGMMKYNAALTISKPNCDVWINIMEFALKRTDLKMMPIEPFGVITLNNFIDTYKPENIYIAPEIHFNMKENYNEKEQFVVHLYDCTWRENRNPE